MLKVCSVRAPGLCLCISNLNKFNKFIFYTNIVAELLFAYGIKGNDNNSINNFANDAFSVCFMLQMFTG